MSHDLPQLYQVIVEWKMCKEGEKIKIHLLDCIQSISFDTYITFFHEVSLNVSKMLISFWFIILIRLDRFHIQLLSIKHNPEVLSYRFHGHLFDIKNNLNTTVARHFGSCNDRTDPNMTIHILEYIRLPKDLPRSSSLRDNRNCSGFTD